MGTWRRMTVLQMINLCNAIVGIPKAQIRIIAHEVYKEYEYIDYMDLSEHSYVRHRIRKFMGQWAGLY